MIVSGACFIGSSSSIATSHFDGIIRLWLDYRTAELRIDGDRAEIHHDGLVMRDAEIGAWWAALLAR